MNEKQKQHIRNVINTLINVDGSPVKIGLGYVDEDNFCNDDAVIVYDCPPSRLKALVEKNFLISVEVGTGVIVERGL